jgi:hypothetical protein
MSEHELRRIFGPRERLENECVDSYLHTALAFVAWYVDVVLLLFLLSLCLSKYN